MFEVIVFSLIGGVISLLGGMLLVRKKKTAQHLAIYATPFAAGILLAAAFTDLLPEALAEESPRPILLAALGGIIGFFLLERFLNFFHHHHEHEGQKKRANNSLIIIGDTLHNALDGVAIGAAFLIDVPTGIVAAMAVAAHEIPQEIGDFGLLLKNGMDKTKVIIVNVISALATTATAVLTFSIGDGQNGAVPYLLAVTAGFFIYVAASDIIPEIHEKATSKTDIRPWLLVLGAVFILLVSPIAHDYIDVGHQHSNTELEQLHPDEAPHSDHEGHSH